MTTTSLILAVAILAQPLMVCGLLIRSAIAPRQAR